MEGNSAMRALVKDLRAINIGKHSCLSIVNQYITWLYSIESTHRFYLLYSSYRTCLYSHAHRLKPCYLFKCVWGWQFNLAFIKKQQFFDFPALSEIFFCLIKK